MPDEFETRATQQVERGLPKVLWFRWPIASLVATMLLAYWLPSEWPYLGKLVVAAIAGYLSAKASGWLLGVLFIGAVVTRAAHEERQNGRK